jgi:clumping factor A
MARRAERIGCLMLSIASWSLASRAQVAERFAIDQRGDFALIGNTLAEDCALPVAPVVGEVGACGANADDTGSDVLWSVAEDGSAPIASTAVSPAEAASIATLALPEGASITHAELFWSAQAGAGDGGAATLARGAVAVSVPAADTLASVADTNDYYQSSADVTAFVRDLGAGPYRVSGIDAADPVGRDDTAYYAAWWLVVFYALDSEPLRHLGLYAGFGVVNVDEPISATLAGFEVPRSGIDGKLGVVGFDGDADLDGDQVRFGRLAPLGDAARLDASNNFFDGSRRSVSGAPLSVSGDRPQFTGDSGSLSGVDLHVVDVGATLAPGQTSAELLALTTSDRYFMSGLVLSVATTSPDLTRSTESVRDVNGPPLRPGDELEYTISVENTGTGAAPSVTLSAPLPPQVSYVPGSLAISAGAQAGALTDEADADSGELDPSAGGTLVVRLGEGASSSSGGRLAAGESSVIRYRVVLGPDASGSIVSQALIGLEPSGSGSALVTPTDSDLEQPGATPTQINVDACALDADCAGGRCDARTSPARCVACLADADCSGLAPSCDASGACACVPRGPELRCDGQDDDCDGAIDEGLAGAACTVGEGLCQAAGVTVCAADGGVLCRANPDAALPEECSTDAACAADDLDCPANPNDDAAASGELPGPVDTGADALKPVGETPADVGTPPESASAAPQADDIARTGSSSAATLGGGGCDLTHRGLLPGGATPSSARGREPWLVFGLALLLRRRERQR